MMLLLLACKGDDGPALTDDSGDSTLQRHSEVYVDSDSPTDTVDTGEPGPRFVDLSVSPGAMSVGVGGETTLRAVVTDSEGSRADAAPTWTSSDPAVATVDAEGHVVAIAAGTATLTADFEGLSATSLLTVNADHSLSVDIVDAETGSPLPYAYLTINGEKFKSDAAGHVVVDAGTGAPVDLSAWVTDGSRIPATFYAVTPRAVTLPLRSVDAEDGPPATIGGAVDLSGCVESESVERIIGLSGASISQHPLFFDAGDLLAEDRTISFYGIDVDLPSNLYVEEFAETWAAAAFEGPVAAWTLAGPVPISEISSGITYAADAFEVLIAHMDDFRFEVVGGLSAAEGAPVDQTLRPALEASDTILAEIPSLPLGFGGDERPLLLVLEPVAEGLVVTGMGSGTGAVTVSRVPAADEGWLLAIAEVGGIGTDKAKVASVAPIVDGAATVPEWMDAPVIDAFDGTTGTFTVSTDERGRVVRIWVRSYSGESRDLYLPSGVTTGTISRVNAPDMGFGRTDWFLLEVESVTGTYDSAFVEDGFSTAGLEADVSSTARLHEFRKGA